MTSSFQPGEGPSRPFSSLREPSFEALVGSAGPAINLNSVTTAGRAAQHTLSPVGRLLRGEIIIATDGDNITSCSNNTTATRESDRANNVGPRAKWKETSAVDQTSINVSRHSNMNQSCDHCWHVVTHPLMATLPSTHPH